MESENEIHSKFLLSPKKGLKESLSLFTFNHTACA